MLIKADDAIEIDNSHISKKEQFERVLKLIEVVYFKINFYTYEPCNIARLFFV